MSAFTETKLKVVDDDGVAQSLPNIQFKAPIPAPGVGADMRLDRTALTQRGQVTMKTIATTRAR